MAQSPDKVNHLVSRAVEAPAGAAGAAPTTEEIRSRIEETRAEMSDTIDAIQTRLSPKRVLADAKETVTDATTATVKRLADRANDVGGGALRRAQEHPIPTVFAASAAAGLVARTVWRAANRRRRFKPYGASYSRRNSYRGACSRRNARLLTLVGAGTACWLFWKARNATARVERVTGLAPQSFPR